MMSRNDVFAINAKKVIKMPSHMLRVWAARDETNVYRDGLDKKWLPYI